MTGTILFSSLVLIIIVLALLTKNKFKKHEHKRFCVTLTSDQVEALQTFAKEKNNNAGPEDTLKLIVVSVLIGFSQDYQNVAAEKNEPEQKVADDD